MTPAKSPFPTKLAAGVTLKPLRVEDSGQFFAFVNQNRAYLERYDPFVKDFQTVEDVQKTLANTRSLYQAGKSLSCGMWDQDSLIGYFLCRLDLDTKVIKTGYAVAPGYQGRGIVAQAGRLVIDYAFNVLGMESARLTCWTNNAKSIRVAERLGFTPSPNILPAEPEKGITSRRLEYILTKSN